MGSTQGEAAQSAHACRLDCLSACLHASMLTVSQLQSLARWWLRNLLIAIDICMSLSGDQRTIVRLKDSHTHVAKGMKYFINLVSKHFIRNNLRCPPRTCEFIKILFHFNKYIIFYLIRLIYIPSDVSLHVFRRKKGYHCKTSIYYSAAYQNTINTCYELSEYCRIPK